MKNKLRRAFALVLASVMLMSLCACVQTDNPGTTAPRPEGGQYYWEMLDSVKDTSELPDWTGDTLEIKVWVAGGTQAIFGTLSETNVTFKELERVTGVRFNVEDSYGNGGDSIDAKLPKVIASRDLPNMIMGWNIGAQMEELYDNGYLADLTPYIENGDLDQVLELYPLKELDEVVWSVLKNKATGDIYTIPSAVASSYYYWTGYSPDCFDAEYYREWNGVPSTATGMNYTSTMWIRDDVLQALYPDAYTYDELVHTYMEGEDFTKEMIFDIPLKSTEDVVEMFRDMKELLDSGDFVGIDGKKMEVTYGPNSETDNWDWMQVLPRTISDFSNGSSYFSWTNMNAGSEDEVTELAFKSEKYIDFYKTINTLVNEDVFSQNSLVDNAQIFTEKYNAGHYAVIYGGVRPTQPWDVGKTENWSYRPVYVDVKADLNYQSHQTLASLENWAIFKDTMTEAQVEQLVHAINYLYSDIGVKNFVWGPKSAGLFTEDENGNRTYTTEELKACMLLNENNGENVKYGLINRKVGDKTFEHFPFPKDQNYMTPYLLNAPYKERLQNEAMQKYNPAAVDPAYDQTLVTKLPKTNQIYSLGIDIEGVKEFWAARAGFESQMKKMLAATPDKFEQEMQKLFEYAEDNGLTDEVLKEYNELFIETNREYLKAYGVID